MTGFSLVCRAVSLMFALSYPVCFPFCMLHRLPASMSTFDLVSQLAALMLRIVDNGRRGRRPQAIFFHLASVTFLSGQHALATFPLVKVIPGLCEVDVEATGVFFVCAGTQTDTITWGGKKKMPMKPKKWWKEVGGECHVQSAGA